MGANSKIEWTHHTFNPWTECEKVSAGCANCYAESWSKRSGVVKWGPNGTRRKTSKSNWQQPMKWDREARAAGERRRVFCASLADVFENRPELEAWRSELFDLISDTQGLDWLLLTKRPGNIRTFYSDRHGTLPNVWLGTSVENQEAANDRIPRLLMAPAVVHFLSCEPLLGPVDLWGRLMSSDGFAYGDDDIGPVHRSNGGVGIDWVIVGGESGHGARPCDVAWIRSLRDQCSAVGTDCFIKQLGSRPRWPIKDGHLDGPAIVNPKGGDWDEWPEDLRVREFPTVSQIA